MGIYGECPLVVFCICNWAKQVNISMLFPITGSGGWIFLVHMQWFYPRHQSHTEILKHPLEGKWDNRVTKITQPLSFHMHIVNVSIPFWCLAFNGSLTLWVQALTGKGVKRWPRATAGIVSLAAPGSVSRGIYLSFTEKCFRVLNGSPHIFHWKWMFLLHLEVHLLSPPHRSFLFLSF